MRSGGVQAVKTKAIRLHCQSAPRAALEIGSGDARLTDSRAATQANVTIAVTSTIPLRVQRLEIMALGSWLEVPEIRTALPGPM